MSNAFDAALADPINLSVRETRMIVERILLMSGIPQGLLQAARDCVLYSQAAGLGGLRTLKRDFGILKQSSPEALVQRDVNPDNTALDCAGQHAWLVASAALDLALAGFRTGRGGPIHVENLSAPEELKVIEALAGRYRAKAEVAPIDSASRLTVRILGDDIDDNDTVLESMLMRGLAVPRSLWREFYEWSHEALSPDSIVSRRHAGPVMVDAEGRVHGRDDDDTDFALLVGSKDGDGRVQEDA